MERPLVAQSGRPHDVGFGMKALPAVRSADVRFWAAFR
jgi:hypothetical protein